MTLWTADLLRVDRGEVHTSTDVGPVIDHAEMVRTHARTPPAPMIELQVVTDRSRQLLVGQPVRGYCAAFPPEHAVPVARAASPQPTGTRLANLGPEAWGEKLAILAVNLKVSFHYVLYYKAFQLLRVLLMTPRVGLITQRSRVQIPPPQPTKSAYFEYFCPLPRPLLACAGIGQKIPERATSGHRKLAVPAAHGLFRELLWRLCFSSDSKLEDLLRLVPAYRRRQARERLKVETDGYR